MALEIHCLTLNCWGIPYVSSHRKQRMKAISEQLASGKFDIVCLQEIWSSDDFSLLREVSKDVLLYSHYFHSGVLGSGLCVFSKYPIKETFFHQWPLNGYIHKIQHGDWFGGKGIGFCHIDCGGYMIHLYNVHFHAEYNRVSDEYRSHRVQQAFDTAQFIRLTSGIADAIILAGDLNTEPNDLGYKILMHVAQLNDPVLQLYDDSQELGTNECAKNSYTPSKVSKERPLGKRIDYVLYKSGKNAKIELKKYLLPFPEKINSEDFSYSDHEAVQATFALSTLDSAVSKCEDLNKECFLLSLKEGISVCEHALTYLKKHKIFYYFCSFVLLIILLGTASFEVPIGYREVLFIFKIIITFLMFFAFLMATLWNRIEENATVSGIKNMEILLQQTL